MSRMAAKESSTAVITCTRTNATTSREVVRCMASITNRGARGDDHRVTSTAPRTTEAVSNTRESAPVARVEYQRAISASRPAGAGRRLLLGGGRRGGGRPEWRGGGGRRGGGGPRRGGRRGRGGPGPGGGARGAGVAAAARARGAR